MRAIAFAMTLAVAACSDGGGQQQTQPDLAQAAGDLAVPPDLVSISPCGATGPFGSYTMVRGGQSGLTACGHKFTSFTDATLTLTGSGTSGLLTVMGTGDIGDTTDCAATISGCDVTANTCATGSSSYVTYTFTAYTHQLTGTVQVQIIGPGADCAFPYSIEGNR
jgi:hypothetical protein